MITSERILAEASVSAPTGQVRAELGHHGSGHRYIMESNLWIRVDQFCTMLCGIKFPLSRPREENNDVSIDSAYKHATSNSPNHVRLYSSIRKESEFGCRHSIVAAGTAFVDGQLVIVGPDEDST